MGSGDHERFGEHLPRTDREHGAWCNTLRADRLEAVRDYEDGKLPVFSCPGPDSVCRLDFVKSCWPVVGRVIRIEKTSGAKPLAAERAPSRVGQFAFVV